MTNEQIIFSESLRLMKEGTIKSTGRKIEVQTPAGEVQTIDEPEPLHTFAAWRELGYTVRRGEHATARIWIWKARPRKKSEKEQELEKEGYISLQRPDMFKKEAFFFTFSQVEPLKKAAPDQIPEKAPAQTPAPEPETSPEPETAPETPAPATDGPLSVGMQFVDACGDLFTITELDAMKVDFNNGLRTLYDFGTSRTIAAALDALGPGSRLAA